MRAALLILCAAVACARAATIARDLSVIPAVKVIDNERKLPQETQKPEENNSSEEELTQQTLPPDQFTNDLRSQSVEEVHIPVQIVQEPQPVLKTTPEKEKDSENEVKPPRAEDNPGEDNEAETPKPGFIQQGLQTIQALQQAAAITVQNALRPQGDEQTTGTGSNFLQQSFQNLQNAFQTGIQSINQTVANYLNNPASQSDEASSNQNIITTIQHNFQSSFAQLNQTFQNFIHPLEGSKPESSPASENNIAQIESGLTRLNQEFEIGLKAASDGISVITSGKEEPAPTNPTSPTNPSGPTNVVGAFQQFITNWQQSILNSMQNLNSTVTNFINQGNNQGQSDETTNKPNIVQQGIQNFQNTVQNVQNFITGQRPPQAQSDDGANATKPTNIFVQSLQNFQNLFSGQQQAQAGGANSSASASPVAVIQQGLQNLQQNFQNGINTIQNSFRPQAAGGGAAPPGTGPTRAVDVAAVENAVEGADDSPRKKGGGGGSGDNNNINGASSPVDVPAVENKPEEAPASTEDVKPAERVITE